MKGRILFIVLIFSYCQLNAQNVYPVLIDAYKCINEYDYNNRTDLKERLNISLKFSKNKKQEVKIISDALMAAEFNFNPINDTLLFDFIYEDFVVGGGPCDIYAQSSLSIKMLSIDSYEKSTYNKLPVSEVNNKTYYLMMYLADTESLRCAFARVGGETIGCYAIALRIIIKDGKMVYPSFLWNYGCAQNTHGSQ